MTKEQTPESGNYNEREFNPNTGREHDIVFIEGKKYFVYSLPHNCPALIELRRETERMFPDINSSDSALSNS
jgi:hypothetical protein